VNHTMAKRSTPAKKSRAKKAAAKPAPQPVVEEPPVVEEQKAPARVATPEPEIVEEVAEEGAFDVDVFVDEAFEACAGLIEAGGGLNPDLPGSAFPTEGYKLIPNLADLKYVELAARIKANDPTAPAMPEVQSVVFFLKNGERARHRRPRERYNPEGDA